MRKIGVFYIGVEMCATAACVAPDKQYGFIQSRGGINGNATADTSEIARKRSDKKSLYVVGIDEENEDIVVFTDKEEFVRFPYGEENEVSKDPDMHHLIDGRLYSEYISDNETILKRDGKEVVRYIGREVIKGIFPDGQNIYTLGQKCDGEGFSYRRNGKSIITKENGQILGGLYDVTYMNSGAIYKDSGSLCFCYFKSEDGNNSRSGKIEWHLVKDGKDNILSLDDSSTEIFDLRLANGTICYISQDNYSSEPVLHIGAQAYDFTVVKQTPGRDYRLNTANGRLRFYGSYTTEKAKSITYCQSLSGTKYNMDGKGYIIYENDTDYAWVQYSPQQLTIHTPTNKKVILSGSFEYLSCWNADFSDGKFRIAITPHDRNKRPFVWAEGEKQEYDITGQLASICYY